jgi:hypothetical protein
MLVALNTTVGIFLCLDLVVEPVDSVYNVKPGRDQFTPLHKFYSLCPISTLWKYLVIEPLWYLVVPPCTCWPQSALHVIHCSGWCTYAAPLHMSQCLFWKSLLGPNIAQTLSIQTPSICTNVCSERLNFEQHFNNPLLVKGWKVQQVATCKWEHTWRNPRVSLNEILQQQTLSRNKRPAGRFEKFSAKNKRDRWKKSSLMFYAEQNLIFSFSIYTCSDTEQSIASNLAWLSWRIDRKITCTATLAFYPRVSCLEPSGE